LIFFCLVAGSFNQTPDGDSTFGYKMMIYRAATNTWIPLVTPTAPSHHIFSTAISGSDTIIAGF